MFWKQTKISNFSDPIYTTSKNELKMMLLSRNSKVLDSFPPVKSGKLMPVLCDQVTQCLDSLTISLVSQQAQMAYQHMRQKNCGMHTTACIHNSACELPHMHLFLPETDWNKYMNKSFSIVSTFFYSKIATLSYIYMDII